MTTIFVTGGAGYIGSIVVEELVRAGAHVVVFDNLSRGHREAVHPEALFIEGDLGDRETLDDALRVCHPDAIMHFAAHARVDESMERPFLYLGENVTNGLNLLQSAIACGVRRFIFSSTCNIFGTPRPLPVAEEELVAPSSPYGESKYILERMLAWLDHIYGLRYAVLRYFNAAGASVERGEDNEPALRLIPIALEVVRGKRDSLTIFGDDYPTRDGTCVRDYIHVLDLAQAHILALDALDQGSRIYNLGTGQGFTVKEVIETVRQVTGHPIPTILGSRRPGDPAIVVASSQKIRRELGWKPRYSNLHDMVASNWRWRQCHADGYATPHRILPFRLPSKTGLPAASPKSVP
ncbi:MAG: UDP-glucose 4-epimerase GalE [Ardenticatenaceae bacterium]